MKDTKLTERQRKFAEENHSVLESFLRYRHLPFDEYYDIVIFRFLRAVQQYDEREDLRKYTFKTIAEYHMRSALYNYFKKQNRERQNTVFMSLDYPISNGEFTFGDTIADERVDVCGLVCRKLSRTPSEYRLSHRYSISPAVRQAAVLEVM